MLLTAVYMLTPSSNLNQQKLAKTENWLFSTKDLIPKMGSKKRAKQMTLKENRLLFQKIETDFP